jgi:hemoglobin
VGREAHGLAFPKKEVLQVPHFKRSKKKYRTYLICEPPVTIPLATLPDGIELPETLIRTLVERFYGAVRQDPSLGPLFEAALAGRWESHLDTMVTFWSSVVLRTGRYSGKPHVAHAPLPLTEAHFARWLAIFENTARETCPAPVSDLFIDRAGRIAESLQIGLGIGPKALRLPLPSFPQGVPS